MPIKMTYNWTQNRIKEISAGLSAYDTPCICAETQCSVFTWGNVDAFGSMALVWLPNELTNYTLEEQMSAVLHPELPPSRAVEYKKVQKIVPHYLSGWFSCNNKCLTPQ